ncbi:MAG: glycosyltransferase [Planctomycetota bacterium]
MHSKSNSSSLAEKAPIAVCIVTRNRPDLLRRAIESTLAARPSPSEVVVGDDSDDPVIAKKLCEDFANSQTRVAIRYVRGPQRGLSANRNRAVAASTQPWLLFIDDDAGLFEDSLAGIESMLQQPTIIVTGTEYNGTAKVRRVTPLDADFWGIQRVVPSLDKVRSIVINATIFPRQVFKRARFDEELLYGSDEIDICRHAIWLGFDVRFMPSFRTWHRPDSKDRSEHADRLIRSNIYATLKSKILFERAYVSALLFAFAAPAKTIGHRIKRSGRSTSGGFWRALDPLPFLKGFAGLRNINRWRVPALQA